MRVALNQSSSLSFPVRLLQPGKTHLSYPKPPWEEYITGMVDPEYLEDDAKNMVDKASELISLWGDCDDDVVRGSVCLLPACMMHCGALKHLGM